MFHILPNVAFVQGASESLPEGYEMFKYIGQANALIRFPIKAERRDLFERIFKLTTHDIKSISQPISVQIKETMEDCKSPEARAVSLMLALTAEGIASDRIQLAKAAYEACPELAPEIAGLLRIFYRIGPYPYDNYHLADQEKFPQLKAQIELVKTADEICPESDLQIDFYRDLDKCYSMRAHFFFGWVTIRRHLTIFLCHKK